MIYRIPFSLRPVVAVSDPKAHYAHFKDAIDFVLPEGTPVLAARAGKVIDMKMNSKIGGPDPKYANDVNYITVGHARGEYSQYLHLKFRTAKVKIGDKVKQGQVMAKSGNTGYSTAPHLHFQVFRLTKKAPGWKTTRIIFNEKVKVRRK